jgi:glycosyltransferase involved in cell wall biosynthesis
MKIRINLAFNAGKDLVLPDLKKNRGIGGTEYAVLLLALHLSETSIFDIFIVTKYKLKIVNNYNFNIEEGSILDTKYLTVIPEAYLKKFNLSDCDNLIIWLHHPNINIDYIKLDYPNSTLVALNNSQISTFTNKLQIPIYVIKSFYQSIRLYNLPVIKSLGPEINFGFLGVLRPEKGLHHVASYWNKLIKLYPNSKLHIIGGPYPPTSDLDNNLYIKKIKQIIGRKHQNSIEFHGRIDDLSAVLPKIDIALLNPFSSTEAYPDSILKFYEFGIPVVSGMFNGSSELLRTNSLIQFPNLDPVKAVDKLIKDKRLYEDCRTNALKFIKSHDDSDIKEMWLKLLLSLKNNDMELSQKLLYQKVKSNFILKNITSIILFRIRYTLNYKIRLFINELF